MNKLSYFIALLFGILNNHVTAQEIITKYEINSSIKAKLNSLSVSESNDAATYIEVKTFENDTLKEDSSYRRNDKAQIDDGPIIKHDTLKFRHSAHGNIEFYMGIINDSFLVNPFSIDALTAISSSSNSDSNWKLVFFIPLQSQKLTLVKKPVLKEGELIEGLLEINSVDYRNLKSISNKKLRFELRMYFSLVIPNQKPYQQLLNNK